MKFTDKAKNAIKMASGNKGTLAITRLNAQIHGRKDTVEAIKTLNYNKRFRNVHQGERCFILGNGPSLKNIDLELLKHEQVFTVNHFNKMDNYKAVHTNYHFWMDAAFFDMRDDIHTNMDDVYESYYQIGQERAVCFLPIHAYRFLKRHGVYEQIKSIHYLYVGGFLEKDRKLDVDIQYAISPFATVVQYAVIVAIYMGFSKIYLLGCDTTNILGILNSALENKNGPMHAYNNDGAESLCKQAVENLDMSYILLDQYKLFLGYEKLYEYCSERGIELVNCSDPTLITSIPQISIETVMSSLGKSTKR